jgi:hypothetical protein
MSRTTRIHRLLAALHVFASVRFDDSISQRVAFLSRAVPADAETLPDDARRELDTFLDKNADVLIDRFALILAEGRLTTTELRAALRSLYTLLTYRHGALESMTLASELTPIAQAAGRSPDDRPDRAAVKRAHDWIVDRRARLGRALRGLVR